VSDYAQTLSNCWVHI